MLVKVLLFALYREAVGRRGVEMDLAPGATVGDAWNALVDEYPVMREHGESIAFALNGRYTEREHSLTEGDELALIPPVSGGSHV
jgi:MoaE-MoaD fusion protein